MSVESARVLRLQQEKKTLELAIASAKKSHEAVVQAWTADIARIDKTIESLQPAKKPAAPKPTPAS